MPKNLRALPKFAKSRLPVDVRRSKTCLLWEKGEKIARRGKREGPFTLHEIFSSVHRLPAHRHTIRSLVQCSLTIQFILSVVGYIFFSLFSCDIIVFAKLPAYSYSFIRCKLRPKSSTKSTLLRNGPGKNDSNNGNEHVGMQKRC